MTFLAPTSQRPCDLRFLSSCDRLAFASRLLLGDRGDERARQQLSGGNGRNGRNGGNGGNGGNEEQVGTGRCRARAKETASLSR
jgi:hypothetical protein